jgi:hypothetical protein
MDELQRAVRPLQAVETDVEKAVRFKKELGESVEKICEIITRAKRDGIVLSFSTQQDALGKTFIAALNAFREL